MHVLTYSQEQATVFLVTREKSQKDRGHSALAAYLAARGETPYAFARRAMIDYAQLLKILRGEGGRRMTVNLAIRIRDATDGEVAVDSWSTNVN